jgi:hypothetical protein
MPQTSTPVTNMPRYRRFIAKRLRSLESAFMELDEFDHDSQRDSEPALERAERELRRVARELGAIA